MVRTPEGHYSWRAADLNLPTNAVPARQEPRPPVVVPSSMDSVPLVKALEAEPIWFSKLFHVCLLFIELRDFYSRQDWESGDRLKVQFQDFAEHNSF